MSNFLPWLFSSQGFMPHGHCYLWQPATLWLNVGSDALIASAYFAIPGSLYFLVRRRLADLPFPRIFLMFAAFILLCGLTHVMEIWTVWNPVYRLSGTLKLLTGIVSMATTITLFRLMPLVLQLRSPHALQREVEVRTAELAEANTVLRRTVEELERQREELKTTHRAKNESLALLATTLRSVGDAVISTDAAGAVQFMNTIAEQLTGWGEEEARGMPVDAVFCIVNEHTRESMESPVTRVLREGKIVGLANHTILLGRAGKEYPIEDSGAPIIHDSRLAGVVLVFRDATDQREKERRFVALANTIPQLAWTNSSDDRHEFFNRGWYLYTGLTEAESLSGDAWAHVVHPSDYEHTKKAWNHALETGDPYDVECRLRAADGTYRWFIVRANADVSPAGRVIEWFGTCTDIDKAKHNEENLRQTEAALREADRRKDVFLATLSHELRNPLSPIRNAAKILENDALTPSDIERCRLIIGRQVRHMASLLDDLLDVSRITRGVVSLKKEYVNLQGLLAEAVETARPLIDAKRHTLKLEWPEHPIEVEADPVRLVQIVANLLTNAAKYTDPEGEITFGAGTDDDGVVLFVRDTGVGLAPEMRTQVFEMFSQIPSNQERSQGGLGIGLALVKGLVELHGGRVEARSAGLERGSEFIVTLPHVRVATGTFQRLVADRAREPDQARAHRVLVADDNRDGAESLGLLLEMSGHEVVIAHTGAEALRLAAKHRPHVAILDIGMPEMSGYDVAQLIRREAWGAHMRLIAITGWGQEDDKRRALRAGFDHHLTKPIDPAALDTLLNS